MYEYANRISARGHKVTLLHTISRPFKKKSAPIWIKRLIFFLRGVGRPKWFPLRKDIQCRIIPEATNRYIEDADVIISTWWEMAHMVGALNMSKGAKFNLVQDYEIWSGNVDSVIASYKLPLRYLCISKYLQKLVAEHALELPFHLPNAIDLRFFCCTRPPKDRHPASVIMLFSSEARKGSKYGVEAIIKLRERFPDIKVTLFGVVPRPDLPNWIQYHQKPQNLPDLYNQHAIFISPSLGEGWALPPAEAMCCGCAVVCTEIGGHLDYAIEGRTALLVPPENPTAIFLAVAELVENRDKRFILAEEGARFISSNFDWEKNTETLIAKFKEVIQTAIKN